MVFRHLIVPLDGSRLAEAALPPAASLALHLHARVTLLHLLEQNPPQEVHGQRHLVDSAEARDYLREVAVRAFPANVTVDQHVHTIGAGDVISGLVDHIAELHGDLFIMCPHGRSSLNLRLQGSLPQRVLGLGTTPVLLIHSLGAGTPIEFACRRILLPLDGDPNHAQGLPVAAGLAQACQAGLHLVMVVPTLVTLPGERAATAALLPGTTAELLSLSQQAATDYLHRQASNLSATGLAVATHVLRGDPAGAILRSAHQVAADLIVMGTHGRMGMKAFWSDSLAPKIASRTRLPLLLVPVESPGVGRAGVV